MRIPITPSSDLQTSLQVAHSLHQLPPQHPSVAFVALVAAAALAVAPPAARHQVAVAAPAAVAPAVAPVTRPPKWKPDLSGGPRMSRVGKVLRVASN